MEAGESVALSFPEFHQEVSKIVKKFPVKITLSFLLDILYDLKYQQAVARLLRLTQLCP